LPGRPIGKRRAAPDSDSLKHRFCAATEKAFRRDSAGRDIARQYLPHAGKNCRAATANISTLKKRHGAFVGKIPVNGHAYEKIAAVAAHKKRAALARRSLQSP